MTSELVAQSSSQGSGGAIGGVVGGLIGLLVAIIVIAAMWKMFTKAGKPGWAAIIPIYNYMVLAQIAGYPAWYGLLVLIPFVNIVILILIAIRVAKAFGKSAAWGFFLLVLIPIGYLILGFGDARYQGPPVS
jgi:hypothetical protein